MKAICILRPLSSKCKESEFFILVKYSSLVCCVVLVLSFGLAAQTRLDLQNTNYMTSFQDASSQKMISDNLWKPCISPFVEILGKGFFSLNVDFRKKENHSVSLGVAGIEEGISPNMMLYFFMGKKHRVETGGGLSGNIYQGSVINMFVHGVIGYRYQKKNGIFFRGGFTPMMVIPFKTDGKSALIPWAGISLGYSF